MAGLELVGELARSCLATVVVVVTGHASPEDMAAAMLAGAYAVLDKAEAPQALADVTCQAAAAARRAACITGESPAVGTPRSAGRALAGREGPTARRRALLALLGEGLSNQDIARRLGTTEGVVKD